MSWYYKHNEREFGPMEERTVIAKLIDGEINSRTLVKDRFDGNYRMLLETDFNAILGHLTSRWRYNIGALKREFIYLMISLAVWLVPLLTYLGGLFNSEVREILLSLGVMGIFSFFSFAGFFSTCYFAWVFTYRLWRVVPKSQYKITPGWRIMLTFIPFFRFGWNYCMWIPLTNKLRSLTNYSMKTGKVAAYFYSTSAIILSCSIYAILILPWSYSLLNGKWHDALWENILGWLFIGLLVLSFFVTIISFIIMAQKMKLAALAIIRHRYAYNVCTQTKNSAFLESTLKRQRHYDKVHRWGHGLGIGGVLVGWPLLLIGVPTLILFIVGSCKYEKTGTALENAGYPSSLVQLYKYANVPDNALEDLRDIKNNAGSGQLEKIFAHNSLAIPADWNNPEKLVEISDLAALKKLSCLLHGQTVASMQKNNPGEFAANIAKYNKYLLWLLSSVVPDVYNIGLTAFEDFIQIINSNEAKKLAADSNVAFHIKNSEEIIKVLNADMFVIANLLKEARFDNAGLPQPLTSVGLWMHVYKHTPFIYFSKNAIMNKVLNIAAAFKNGADSKGLAALTEDYKNSSFILKNAENEINLLKTAADSIKKLKKINKNIP